MADNDPMMAMDSKQESAAVPNYNMGYQSMMAGYDNVYGNGYNVASRPNYSNFAHRSGGVAAGGQTGGNSGNSAAANNGAAGGAAGNGGTDYDYMAASDALNRQISHGIGVSGYGGGYGGNAGYGGGYGGYNGASGAGARFGGGGSGYGGGGYTPVNVLGSGYGAVCGDEGLNPALVLGTLVGAAAAFAVLFRQVTLGRKKRRDFGNDDGSFGFDGVVGWLGDLAWNGEF